MRRYLVRASAMVLVAVTSLVGSAEAQQDPPARIAAAASVTPSRGPGILRLPARLHVENVSLEEALKRLQATSSVPVAFSPTLLPTERTVACRCTDETVEDAVRTLLRGTGFEYAVLADHLIIRIRERPQIPAAQNVLELPPQPYRLPTGVALSHREPEVARFTAAKPNVRIAGSIIGRVTNSQTGRPVAGAQISISGTGIGTLTNGEGRYLLVNVPAGMATISVVMIGYAQASQVIEVAEGQTIVTDFTLSERAIAMDEIVVTGAAGATQRRELGNALSTVNASQVVERMPISSVDELLMGRVAGVNMSLSGGGGFFGGQIRIRGSSSVSLSNDPVIYIDGVRVDGSHDSRVSIGGQTLSRLVDLQPSEIERVEIVKGAAAASLYGTQGSNGVVQIFTKRGRTGAPEWTFEVQQGLERVPTDTFPGRLFNKFVGPDGFRARDPVEIVENGYHSKYSASVSGGGESTRYFLSGSFRDAEGSIAPVTNWINQYSGRANLTTLLTPDISVTVTTGLVHSRLRVPDNDNALHGTYSQIASAVPYTATEIRPYGERFGSFVANQTVENHQRVIRNTTGISVKHDISADLRHEMNLGIDWFVDEFTKFFPYAYEGSGNKLGNKRNNTRTRRDITTDYRAHFIRPFSPSLSSTLTLGFQGNFSNTIIVDGRGTDFPAPGVRSISATAITSADERRVEDINAGVFVQEMVGISDKLFLTGAIRLDGNSAFGNEFSYQIYPKASVAYNVSDEGFWNVGFVPTFKFRAAYGESGLAPTQFAADRTYAPISAQDGVPAVTPGNIGDPTLGPERSQELELGFDAGLWNDRIGLEVTAFFQKTTDALLQRPFPPSRGFLSTQLTNIGAVENRGVEVGLSALLLRSEAFEWTSNIQFTAQSNKVTDMGGVPEFGLGTVRIHEGYPVQGMWGFTMAGWDPVTRSHTASKERVFVGQANPKRFGSLSSDVRVGNFSFSGLIEYTGGQVKNNFSRYWSTRVRTGDDYLSLLNDERGKRTPAADSLNNLVQTVGSSIYIEPAGYTSIRELAVAYQMPDALLSRVGLRRSSIRLSARNVWLFTEFSGISPETNYRGAANLGGGEDFDTQPVPRIFLLTFRTSW